MVFLHWNWGWTPHGDAINSLIGTRIGVSVRLVICGTIIGMAGGVAIGAWSAVRQYSAADRIVSFLFTGTPKNLTNYGAATFQTTRAEDFGYVKI